MPSAPLSAFSVTYHTQGFSVATISSEYTFRVELPSIPLFETSDVISHALPETFSLGDLVEVSEIQVHFCNSCREECQRQ